MSTNWLVQLHPVVNTSAVIDKSSPFKHTDMVSASAEVKRCISALQSGEADTTILKSLALLCLNNPVNEDSNELKSSFSIPSSPSPMTVNFNKLRLSPVEPMIWDEEKLFDRLFHALLAFLTPGRVCSCHTSNDDALI